MFDLSVAVAGPTSAPFLEMFVQLLLSSANAILITVILYQSPLLAFTLNSVHH